MIRSTILLILLFGLSAQHCQGGKMGTLRQRLAANSDDEPDPLASSSTEVRPQRRGGLRRRLLSSDGGPADPAIVGAAPDRDSGPLYDDLLHRWAKGQITSEAVQSIANKCYAYRLDWRRADGPLWNIWKTRWQFVQRFEGHFWMARGCA